jgi:hypothetical protein
VHRTLSGAHRTVRCDHPTIGSATCRPLITQTMLPVSLSTAEAEYVAVGQCCAQLLWMRQTLRDFGYNLSEVPLLCDNESAIHLADNPVEHSRTKHIDIRHHFLKDHQQKGDIDIYHISTEN